MLRRAVFPLLCLWVALALTATIWAGQLVWGAARDNRAIRDLAGGRDVVLHDGSNPRAAHARALYLALRDRPQDAEAMAPALAGAAPGLQSEFHYALGNARMRMGFDRIERNRIDEATALINLAKASYRQALLAWADDLREVRTICHCGRKATMVVRQDEHGTVLREGAQVQIGGNETYVSLCRRHWREATGEPI